MTEQTLPVPVAIAESLSVGASPALAIMLNDGLYDRCRSVAGVMSKAVGATPKHLIGCPEACYAVVTRAIIWRMDPFSVAACTYQTPGGSIGYEGKLIQAILENSGKIVGGVKYEHYGDWSKIQGKTKEKTNDKGKTYMVPAWNTADEAGVGVKVIAQLKDETEPRTLSFDLVEAHPRNSTLWALSPKRQICYTAVRAFANLVVPHLVMGIPFDADQLEAMAIGPENARDITPEPKPTREAVNAEVNKAAPETVIEPDKADAEKAEADARELDQQAAATLNGRMPDTAEERGDAPEPQEENKTEPAKSDEDLTPPAALDRRPNTNKRSTAKKTEPPKTEPTAQPEETQEQINERWIVVAKNMLKQITKTAGDLPAWRNWVKNTEAERDQMREEAPEVWSKLNAHIQAKEESIRA